MLEIMLEKKFWLFVAICVLVLTIMTGSIIHRTDRLNESMDELTRSLDELDKAVGGTNEEIKPVAP